MLVHQRLSQFFRVNDAMIGVPNLDPVPMKTWPFYYHGDYFGENGWGEVMVGSLAPIVEALQRIPVLGADFEPIGLGKISNLPPKTGNQRRTENLPETIGP